MYIISIRVIILKATFLGYSIRNNCIFNISQYCALVFHRLDQEGAWMIICPNPTIHSLCYIRCWPTWATLSSRPAHQSSPLACIYTPHTECDPHYQLSMLLTPPPTQNRKHLLYLPDGTHNLLLKTYELLSPPQFIASHKGPLKREFPLS